MDLKLIVDYGNKTTDPYIKDMCSVINRHRNYSDAGLAKYLNSVELELCKHVRNFVNTEAMRDNSDTLMSEKTLEQFDFYTLVRSIKLHLKDPKKYQMPTDRTNEKYGYVYNAFPLVKKVQDELDKLKGKVNSQADYEKIRVLNVQDTNDLTTQIAKEDADYNFKSYASFFYDAYAYDNAIFEQSRDYESNKSFANEISKKSFSDYVKSGKKIKNDYMKYQLNSISNSFDDLLVFMSLYMEAGHNIDTISEEEIIHYVYNISEIDFKDFDPKIEKNYSVKGFCNFMQKLIETEKLDPESMIVNHDDVMSEKSLKFLSNENLKKDLSQLKRTNDIEYFKDIIKTFKKNGLDRYVLELRDAKTVVEPLLSLNSIKERVKEDYENPDTELYSVKLVNDLKNYVNKLVNSNINKNERKYDQKTVELSDGTEINVPDDLKQVEAYLPGITNYILTYKKYESETKSGLLGKKTVDNLRKATIEISESVEKVFGDYDFQKYFQIDSNVLDRQEYILNQITLKDSELTRPKEIRKFTQISKDINRVPSLFERSICAIAVFLENYDLSKLDDNACVALNNLFNLSSEYYKDNSFINKASKGIKDIFDDVFNNFEDFYIRSQITHDYENVTPETIDILRQFFDSNEGKLVKRGNGINRIKDFITAIKNSGDFDKILKANSKYFKIEKKVVIDEVEDARTLIEKCKKLIKGDPKFLERLNSEKQFNQLYSMIEEHSFADFCKVLSNVDTTEGTFTLDLNNLKVLNEIKRSMSIVFNSSLDDPGIEGNPKFNQRQIFDIMMQIKKPDIKASFDEPMSASTYMQLVDIFSENELSHKIDKIIARFNYKLINAKKPISGNNKNIYIDQTKKLSNFTDFTKQIFVNRDATKLPFKLAQAWDINKYNKQDNYVLSEDECVLQSLLRYKQLANYLPFVGKMYTKDQIDINNEKGNEVKKYRQGNFIMSNIVNLQSHDADNSPSVELFFANELFRLLDTEFDFATKKGVKTTTKFYNALATNVCFDERARNLQEYALQREIEESPDESAPEDGSIYFKTTGRTNYVINKAVSADTIKGALYNVLSAVSEEYPGIVQTPEMVKPLLYRILVGLEIEKVIVKPEDIDKRINVLLQEKVLFRQNEEEIKEDIQYQLAAMNYKFDEKKINLWNDQMIADARNSAKKLLGFYRLNDKLNDEKLIDSIIELPAKEKLDELRKAYQEKLAAKENKSNKKNAQNKDAAKNENVENKDADKKAEDKKVEDKKVEDKTAEQLKAEQEKAEKEEEEREKAQIEKEKADKLKADKEKAAQDRIKNNLEQIKKGQDNLNKVYKNERWDIMDGKDFNEAWKDASEEGRLNKNKAWVQLFTTLINDYKIKSYLPFVDNYYAKDMKIVEKYLNMEPQKFAELFKFNGDASAIEMNKAGESIIKLAVRFTKCDRNTYGLFKNVFRNENMDALLQDLKSENRYTFGYGIKQIPDRLIDKEIPALLDIYNKIAPNLNEDDTNKCSSLAKNISEINAKLKVIRDNDGVYEGTFNDLYDYVKIFASFLSLNIGPENVSPEDLCNFEKNLSYIEEDTSEFYYKDSDFDYSNSDFSRFNHYMYLYLNNVDKEGEDSVQQKLIDAINYISGSRKENYYSLGKTRKFYTAYRSVAHMQENDKWEKLVKDFSKENLINMFPGYCHDLMSKDSKEKYSVLEELYQKDINNEKIIHDHRTLLKGFKTEKSINNFININADYIKRVGNDLNNALKEVNTDDRLKDIKPLLDEIIKNINEIDVKENNNPSIKLSNIHDCFEKMYYKLDYGNSLRLNKELGFNTVKCLNELALLTQSFTDDNFKLHQEDALKSQLCLSICFNHLENNMIKGELKERVYIYNRDYFDNIFNDKAFQKAFVQLQKDNQLNNISDSKAAEIYEKCIIEAENEKKLADEKKENEKEAALKKEAQDKLLKEKLKQGKLERQIADMRFNLEYLRENKDKNLEEAMKKFEEIQKYIDSMPDEDFSSIKDFIEDYDAIKKEFDLKYDNFVGNKENELKAKMDSDIDIARKELNSGLTQELFKKVGNGDNVRYIFNNDAFKVNPNAAGGIESDLRKLRFYMCKVFGKNIGAELETENDLRNELDLELGDISKIMGRDDNEIDEKGQSIINQVKDLETKVRFFNGVNNKLTPQAYETFKETVSQLTNDLTKLMAEYDAMANAELSEDDMTNQMLVGSLYRYLGDMDETMKASENNYDLRKNEKNLEEKVIKDTNEELEKIHSNNDFLTREQVENKISELSEKIRGQKYDSNKFAEINVYKQLLDYNVGHIEHFSVELINQKYKDYINSTQFKITNKIFDGLDNLTFEKINDYDIPIKARIDNVFKKIPSMSDKELIDQYVNIKQDSSSNVNYNVKYEDLKTPNERFHAFMTKHEINSITKEYAKRHPDNPNLIKEEANNMLKENQNRHLESDINSAERYLDEAIMEKNNLM